MLANFEGNENEESLHWVVKGNQTFSEIIELNDDDMEIEFQSDGRASIFVGAEVFELVLAPSEHIVSLFTLFQTLLTSI